MSGDRYTVEGFKHTVSESEAALLERYKDFANKDVTRFEVIDYQNGVGRLMVRYGVKVELSYQDGGKTLKVFLT